MTQKTGAEIFEEAYAGSGGEPKTADQETVGRVDAPDEETAEVDADSAA